jgi:F-type H+-transporting ATPase subunit b
MTFSPWTFVLEVINFVVLAYVLYRLLYRPLHAAIDRRRAAVQQEQAQAEKARAEAETIKQQLQDKLAEMDQQRQQIISDSRQQAEAERKKILDEGEQAIDRRREQVERSLAREREEMLKGLSGELVTHAVNLAERLLQQSADSTLQAQLEKHLIEVLNKTQQDQREELRREWQTEDQAWLETAANLNDETLDRMRSAVAAIAGKTLTINAQKNSKLIGGVRLRIGGHVWDASIARQLEATPSSPAESSTHV